MVENRRPFGLLTAMFSGLAGFYFDGSCTKREHEINQVGLMNM